MNHIVIVDPFSTGSLYAPLFNARGLNCIAVISRPDLPTHFTQDLMPEHFTQVLAWSPEVVQTLDALGVLAVIAGCETAIHLTDRLTEHLGLKGNNPATSDARRNKFTMQQALQARGLAHIDTRRVTAPEQIEAVLAAVDDTRQYVIKPINSAATQGVVFATGRQAVAQALDSAGWQQRNDLGEINLGFVLQPFISGPEYVVDMVAFNGTYHIASVCRYTKIQRNGSPFVYDSLDTLDPADTTLAPLIDYARQAAAALGVSVGPLHMEIIWSAHGPVMIEAGARLHGGIAPRLFQQVYQPDLLSLAVDSYLGRPALAGPGHSRQTHHGKIGFFWADRQATFEGPGYERMVAAGQVPGYGGHRYFIGPGDKVPATIDFATCPGLFWLSHDDPRQLARHAEQIRALLWNQ
ncbi:ATP-grasp domain-containing protein [Pseudomonas putida]